LPFCKRLRKDMDRLPHKIKIKIYEARDVLRVLKKTEHLTPHQLETVRRCVRLLDGFVDKFEQVQTFSQNHSNKAPRVKLQKSHALPHMRLTAKSIATVPRREHPKRGH
jgi:hypothetical protein